jgi:hypothetical protein
MFNRGFYETEQAPPLIPFVFEAVAEHRALQEAGDDPAPYRRALLAHLVLNTMHTHRSALGAITRAESELTLHKREAESLLEDNHA